MNKQKMMILHLFREKFSSLLDDFVIQISSCEDKAL